MASVREQLRLQKEYPAVNGKRAELSDAAAAENKAMPIHRWVPWIAGFSGQFVSDAISAYLPERMKDRQVVLDPFAGVGTTLVEALKNGRRCVGYEINAFAYLAALAKVTCTSVSPTSLRKSIEYFEDSMRQFEVRVDRRVADAPKKGVEDILKTLKAGGGREYRSRIPFFSPPVEAKFRYALAITAKLREPGKSIFLSALGATMVSYSNYTYEPSLSSRPGAGKALIPNASVATAVCAKLHTMLEDIEVARSCFGNDWHMRSEILHASYFDRRAKSKGVSLLVTSPPYMNNYHYVRNTRPQLHWLGLVNESAQLRDYENSSFGKFWQTVRQDDAHELAFEFPPILDPINRLRNIGTDRGQYGGPGWANYVVQYFNDCDRFLKCVARDLKPGARAVIVVGNSIIQGIEFRVDELLAELAQDRGLTLDEIRIVRTKRVGSSIVDSSVRNGNGSNGKHSTPLYDSAVVLQR